MYRLPKFVTSVKSYYEENFCHQPVKEAFYRSFNAFYKMERTASKGVMIELINAKRMSVLLYGVEVCPLKRSHTEALQFASSGYCMKIFNTNYKEIERAYYMNVFRDFTVSSVVRHIKNFFCEVYTDEKSMELCGQFVAAAKQKLARLRRKYRIMTSCRLAVVHDGLVSIASLLCRDIAYDVFHVVFRAIVHAFYNFICFCCYQCLRNKVLC